MAKKKRNKKVKIVEDLLKQMDLAEDIIKGNEKVFQYKETKYKVRMPNTGEEIETEEKKNELYVKLLQDDKYLSKEQLVEVFKKKNVDFEKLDEEFKALEEKRIQLMLKLSKIPSENKEAIENLKKDILGLKDKQLTINRKKTNYLQYSIESKVEHFWYMYLTSLVTEKLEKNKWVKCWKCFDNFKKADTQLTGLSMLWTTRLLMGLRQPNFEF